MSFTFNQRLGIFFTVEAAFLSIVAVTSVLCFVGYKWLRKTVLTWRKSSLLSPDATDSSLFLNLMVADLLQAIGAMPNIQWMEQGEITSGHLCTAQAAIKQVGIVGVAMTSLAIAFHTFSVLVLRWRAPRRVSRYVVIGIWVFTAFVIGIPNAINRNKVYYGPTQYWCWILDRYKTEQLVTEYLWVWVAGFSMIILYGIMFVVMKGWFVIDNGVHWHTSYKAKNLHIEPETDEEKSTKAIANLMLFYPAVYILTVFPNSLSRWLYFTNFNTPYQFTLFANTVYDLSGMCNVLLFFWTRPDLVKGPSVVIEEPDDLPLHRKQSHAGLSPHRLGHLPERTYTDNSPTSDKWTGHPDFDAGALITDRVAYSSPNAFNGSMALPTHARSSSYLSDRDGYTGKRSRESTSLIDEEEDYGRLPG